LWQRKTSPGPTLSYFQSLFLQAAQRISSTLFPGRSRLPLQRLILSGFTELAPDYPGPCQYYLYIYSVQQSVKHTFCKMFIENWLFDDHHILCPIFKEKKTPDLPMGKSVN
jgi:hypothetical protein